MTCSSSHRGSHRGTHREELRGAIRVPRGPSRVPSTSAGLTQGLLSSSAAERHQQGQKSRSCSAHHLSHPALLLPTRRMSPCAVTVPGPSPRLHHPLPEGGPGFPICMGQAKQRKPLGSGVGAGLQEGSAITWTRGLWLQVSTGQLLHRLEESRPWENKSECTGPQLTVVPLRICRLYGERK